MPKPTMDFRTEESPSAFKDSLSPQPQRRNIFLRVMKYIIRRVLAVLLTIGIGVFIMVVIANGGGMLDKLVDSQITQRIFNVTYIGNFSDFTEKELAMQAQFRAEMGYSQPFLIKHAMYTWRTLGMGWGEVTNRLKFNTWVNTGKGLVNTTDSREIVLAKLPYTMLLTGAAYLFLMLIGIPLALYLSQHEGRWMDRIVGILTPLSSVPSWVIGTLLVLVFAVQFRWFPVGKMIEGTPPDTIWGLIGEVAHHMVLPVTAIVLSLVFQLVYTWRSYLLIYSNEDYVDLAKAKGLRQNRLNSRYILRPALPYMVTNLALTLVGFWQMITALEYFFQWPGIGKLFVDSLPNFHGESMYAGEMTIVLAIVVLFAYLLGITVFVLDFIYLLVDPRVRVGSQEQTELAQFKQRGEGWLETVKGWFSKPAQPRTFSTPVEKRQRFNLGLTIQSFGREISAGWSGLAATLKTALHEINRVPVARVGLIMAVLLVITSILVVIFIPYDPVGKDWTESNTGNFPVVAKLALPVWVNWFRADDLPPTIVLSSVTGTAPKLVNLDNPDMPQMEIDFTFDYPYQYFPSEVALYLGTQYQEKMPFITPYWITPDGREIELKSVSFVNGTTYRFAEEVPTTRLLRANPNFRKWYVTLGSEYTPEYYLIFADPAADTPTVVQGQYTLRLKGLMFEPGSNIDAYLVVFGRVEGWAGTDYLRRDLSVPLLWGLPIALFVGVVGAVVTSIISILLAAASAWKGGWVDSLVQHATEANLILPVVALGVLLYSYYNISLWIILAIVILSNVLGSSTKVFRAAFLQEKEASYIEAARAYGASDWRIIRRYLIPRILPVIIPQIVMLIPNFIFLEATLAIFNIFDAAYPTWGRILYSALRNGAMYGSRFWVLEPISLMLITGLSFVLISFGLNRMLAPHLR